MDNTNDSQAKSMPPASQSDNLPIALPENKDVLQQRVQELESELAKSQQTIEALKAENERLLWDISRSMFSEADYVNFDPSEYMIPFEEMLAHAKEALNRS